METLGQATYNQAEINAKNIEAEISKLKNGHWANPNKRNYRDFWEHAHYVINLFKLLKPILAEDRERLWNEFSELREQARHQEQADWETRKKESSEKRQVLIDQLEQISKSLETTEDYESVEKARSLLAELLNQIKAVSQTAASPETATTENEDRLMKDDKDVCWDTWRMVNEQAKQKKSEFEEKSFAVVKADALELLKKAETDNPHEALKNLKAMQNDPKIYKFSKPLREEIKSILNECYDKAIKRIREISEESKRRHQEFVKRMESNLERWKELKSKNDGIIANLEAQITKLEEDVANARTPEFGEKIKVWIDEKAVKIKDIKETNQKLDDKINSVLKEIEKAK